MAISDTSCGECENKKEVTGIIHKMSSHGELDFESLYPSFAREFRENFRRRVAEVPGPSSEDSSTSWEVLERMSREFPPDSMLDRVVREIRVEIRVAGERRAIDSFEESLSRMESAGDTSGIDSLIDMMYDRLYTMEGSENSRRLQDLIERASGDTPPTPRRLSFSSEIPVEASGLAPRRLSFSSEIIPVEVLALGPPTLARTDSLPPPLSLNRSESFFPLPVVVLVGCGDSGKTSLARYLVGDPLQDEGSSVTPAIFPGTDFILKATAGREEWGGYEDFASFTREVQHCDVVLYTFDMTSRKSFEAAEWWFDFLKGLGESEGILVGTKCDMEGKAVDLDELREWCVERGVGGFGTSSVTGWGCRELRNYLKRGSEES